MVCCCQVTEVYSSRYDFAIASSAWGPCNFGPFTDLAISVFREMSINTVFTQILTSLCSRLSRNFMRRTGVRASLYWNFIIHQIFPEFLLPIPGSQNHTVFPVPSWFPFYLVLGFCCFGFHQVCPDPSSTKLDTGTGEMSLSVAFSLSRTEISPTVGEEGEDEEDDEE